jgi:hypothetical protein
VINKSSNTPFSIPQCLLPDWDIFEIRPCKSVALSLGPLRYNTSKAIRTVTQAMLRPPPPLTSKTQYIGRCRNPQAYTDCHTFHQAPIVPSTPVKIVINVVHITSDQLPSASMAYYTPIMSTYFNEKYHWSEGTFLSIDWLASDKEYKQLSTGHWMASFKLQLGSGQCSMCFISTY